MAYNGKKNADASRRRPESLGNAFENYPVLRYVLPLAIGIAVGNAGRSVFSEYSSVFFAATLVSAALLIAMLFVKHYSVEKVWFGVVVNLFFVSWGTYTFLRSDDALRFSWSDSPAVYEGVVYDCPKKYDKVSRMRVRLTSCYEKGTYKTLSRTIELTAMRSPETDTLDTGDGVMFFSTVSTPRNTGNPYEPDYASSLIRSGVSGTAFAYNGKLKPLSQERALSIINQNLGFFERAALRARQFRDYLQNKYELSGIGGESLAVLSALTLGDKHLLERSTRELFSITGVSHVLALSGLHLGIIYGILQFLFTAGGFARRMRVPAQAVIIVFIWIYALMAGMPASLIRAAIMYSLVSLAVIMGRKAVTLNNLFVAAFLILLFNPMSLFDIGFQLSFASVFFILAFVRAITPVYVLKRPVLGKLWGMVAVSLCAQMGVAPLVAYYFNQFPVYFIFSNLVVVPVSFVLVAIGLAFLVLSWFQPLAAALAWALKLVLSSMLGVLDVISGLPHASVWIYPSLLTVMLVYAAFFFAVIYLRRKSMLYFVPFACCGLAAVIVETVSNAKERDVAGIYFYKGLSCPVVQFVVSRGESYVYAPSRYADSVVVKSLSGISRNFWRRCGMNAPKRIPDTFVSPFVLRKGCMVQFGRQRVCVLDTAVWQYRIPEGMSADIVYVARGFRGNLPDLRQHLRTEMVVLGERLSDYRRRDITGKCIAAGVKYYDMESKGALKLSAQ